MRAAPLFLLGICIARVVEQGRPSVTVAKGLAWLAVSASTQFWRRHRLGLSPSARRNSRQRWAWSEKPQAVAIWLRGSRVSSISTLARSTRRRMT